MSASSSVALIAFVAAADAMVIARRQWLGGPHADPFKRDCTLISMSPLSAPD